MSVYPRSLALARGFKRERAPCVFGGMLAALALICSGPSYGQPLGGQGATTFEPNAFSSEPRPKDIARKLTKAEVRAAARRCPYILFAPEEYDANLVSFCEALLQSRVPGG